MQVISKIQFTKELADSNPVFVYPTGKKIPQEFLVHLDAFLKNWETHGKALKNEYFFPFENVFVIAVDEVNSTTISGCSKDALRHFMEVMGKKFDCNFFNPLVFHFIENDSLVGLKKAEFKQAYHDNRITDHTFVIDPLVSDVGAYKNGFIKPLKDSWHKRFV